MSGDRGLPDGWKVLPFRQIAESITERVDDPSTAGVDRYVGLDHLDPDSTYIRRWGSPDDVGSTKLRFYPGDVVYGRRRAYQRKLGVAEFEGICSAHALVLRARPEVCVPEFLPYFLQSDAFHERALDISVGSLSPTINWKTLAIQEFTVPSIKDQESVVQLMRAMDLNADALQRATDSSHSLLEAVIAEAPVRSFVPLGEMLVESPANGLTIEPSATPSDVKSLTLGSVDHFGYQPSGLKWVTNTDLGKSVVAPGDLFITRSNTLERVGLPFRFPGAEGIVVYSDLIMRLRPREGAIRPSVLEAYLRSRAARTFIRTIAAGTSASMKKINGRNLKRLPVPEISDEVQDRLEEVLRSQGNLVSGTRRAAEHLQVARRVTLNRSLDGESR